MKESDKPLTYEDNTSVTFDLLRFPNSGSRNNLNVKDFNDFTEITNCGSMMLNGDKFKNKKLYYKKIGSDILFMNVDRESENT